ncbi:MAG: hypothetical protein ABGY41_19060, partial [Candidatus Poribacteria bacterium]
GGGMSVIDVGGGNRRLLAETEGESPHPAWSPDGAWLATTTDNDKAPSQGWLWRSIIVMDTFGGNQRVITSNRRGTDASPPWSPDGRRLAYAAHDDMGPGSTHYRSDIHVVNLDDMSVTQLTDSRDYDGMPSWSP